MAARLYCYFLTARRHTVAKDRLTRLARLHFAPKENLMRSKAFLCAFVIGLALLNFGCDVANNLTSTKIRDLLNHPRDYENKEVTIYGTVTKTPPRSS
jgi:hypothetical protein